MKSKTKTAKKAKRTRTLKANERLASYRIWNWGTRRTRTVSTRAVRFENPAQLIRDAGRVCRKWKPIDVLFWASTGSKKNSISIRYGSDEVKQECYEVEVLLQARDMGIIQEYLAACPSLTYKTVMMTVALSVQTPEADDDGGESLHVPSASDSLAEMRVMGGVQ